MIRNSRNNEQVDGWMDLLVMISERINRFILFINPKTDRVNRFLMMDVSGFMRSLMDKTCID